jgi:putative drug exporter of the RND superfamily
MASRFSTAHIARWCARRPWLVIAAWVVALALAGVAATGLDGALTAGDMGFTNHPESVRGQELLATRMGGGDAPTETVVVHSETLTVNDPAFRSAVTRVAADLNGLQGLVLSAPTYYEAAAAGAPAAQAMVSADRHTTLIPVTLAPEGSGTTLGIDDLVAVVGRDTSSAVQVLTVGSGSTAREFQQTAAKDLRGAELVGLPMTLLVLVLVFGAAVAAGVSIVLAGVAIVLAIGLTALVGHLMGLSFFVVNMVTMIGLAVGIDYALFIIERFREERHKGMPVLDAIGVAGGTASKAVLFSGCTVMLALFGLFIVPITTFRSLGAGAVLVVSAAVAAMLTLVPALLALLGDRIDWPHWSIRSRRWARHKRAAAQGVALPPVGRAAESVYRGFWGRVTKVVMIRPVLSVVLAAGVLIALAVPYTQLQRGSSGAESLPPGDARTAYRLLATEFGGSQLPPLDIVIDVPRAAAGDAAIERVLAALARDTAFAPQPTVRWNDAGDLALVASRLTVPANDPEATAAVHRLRGEILPVALADSGAVAYVTGSPAFNADQVAVIDAYTPWVFTFVLGLSFILLLLVFRSVVVPLKAIIMNLLSVAAAYGVLVVVFQKGLGHELFGFQQTPSIEAWVPIFLFCILFGLSMDYHVFLLSRIREHYDRTGDNVESVAVGLKSTGRIITGAAAIMVVVFATFAAGNLVMMQQVGFGLAIAILLDATLVRIVLVPASMALLGRANWYLPRWLSWLPDLRVEGPRAAGHLPSVPTAQVVAAPPTAVRTEKADQRAGWAAEGGASVRERPARPGDARSHAMSPHSTGGTGSLPQPAEETRGQS